MSRLQQSPVKTSRDATGLGAPRRVTLTFDNGPVAGITDRVLEILAKAGLRSTFFTIGSNLRAPAQTALMHAAHEAGHWIGNHTMTHSVALGERPDAQYARQEIEGAQRRMESCSSPAKLFRPYGNNGLLGPHLLSRAAVRHLLCNRYSTVIWNSVPGDWRDPKGWVSRCVAQVRGQEWSVVVLHDIENACLHRLPELLSRLSDQGVAFVQDFPESVVLTRDGHPVSLKAEFIADAVEGAGQEW